jgi:Fe-S-cluster containining protein
MSDESTTPGALEAGLRFVHAMGMQGRLALEEVEARLEALIELLSLGSGLDRAQLERLFDGARERVRRRSLDEIHVQVGGNVDKYALEDEPDVPCEELLPLCKGRCCQLRFPLSFQDLDEGVVKWSYSAPYQIRQRETDATCVHSDPNSRRCTVYQHRPATCRLYDCREDERIWKDFEARIPAPMPPGQPELVAIRQVDREDRKI